MKPCRAANLEDDIPWRKTLSGLAVQHTATPTPILFTALIEVFNLIHVAGLSEEDPGRLGVVVRNAVEIACSQNRRSVEFTGRTKRVLEHNKAKN